MEYHRETMANIATQNFVLVRVGKHVLAGLPVDNRPPNACLIEPRDLGGLRLRVVFRTSAME